jgi:hypothetical protein
MKVGGTLGMVTMLDESLIMIEVPHKDFEANQKTIPKNQSRNSTIAKLKALPTHSAIDGVGVIFGMVVVCNEDSVFQLRRFLGKWN